MKDTLEIHERISFGILHLPQYVANSFTALVLTHNTVDNASPTPFLNFKIKLFRIVNLEIYLVSKTSSFV